MHADIAPSHDLSIEILNLLFTYRRSLADAHGYRHFCELCNQAHLPRIEHFIANKKPIHMILPGFPAKSPNLNKVLGKLPDKGEQLALKFLNKLCESIKALYPLGAKITICSDGHIFADLVEIADADVDAYNHEIAEIIQREQLSNLDLFGLDDIYNEASTDDNRRKFINESIAPLEEVKQLAKNSDREMAMVNGITKFLSEDFHYLEPTKSKTYIHKKSRRLAYHVVQRSHGWSSVLEKYFPHSIRLSIHPQPCHFQKLGIYLVETKNNWLTPWHGVAVLVNGKFELMKKYEALQLHSKIVIEDGSPSFFIV